MLPVFAQFPASSDHTPISNFLQIASSLILYVNFHWLRNAMEWDMTMHSEATVFWDQDL